MLDEFAGLQGPLQSLWSGASAAANAHLNDLVQLKLEDQLDQGADELRASMRAPGDAPRWVMDGCEALFDSVYDDLRDSLVSYLMIAFGKRTGKYAEARASSTPPADWSGRSCASRLRRLGLGVGLGLGLRLGFGFGFGFGLGLG